MTIGSLRLFDKTNVEGSYVIAAWHSPRLITWRWTIWWTPVLWVRPKVRWHRSSAGYWYILLTLPIVGYLTLNTQSCVGMEIK